MTENVEGMDVGFVGNWDADPSGLRGPPSVVVAALAQESDAGAIDFTTADEFGFNWDFSNVASRNRAFRLVCEEKPLMLIGNATPSASSIQARRAGDGKLLCELEGEEERVKVHRRFLGQLSRLQHRQGRYFVHDVSKVATPGEAQCAQQVREAIGARVLKVDWRHRGLGARALGGADLHDQEGFCFVTNSPAVALALRGGETEKGASESAVANGWRDAVAKGLRTQRDWDCDSRRLIGVIQGGDVSSKAADVERRVPPEEPELDVAWDDVSGKELDPAKVREARRLEMEYYKRMEVYEKVPLHECCVKTGKAPLKAK